MSFVLLYAKKFFLSFFGGMLRVRRNSFECEDCLCKVYTSEVGCFSLADEPFTSSRHPVYVWHRSGTNVTLFQSAHISIHFQFHQKIFSLVREKWTKSIIGDLQDLIEKPVEKNHIF